MKNRYFDIDSCVERLYKEYLKHPKLIVAVDFDSTVYPFHQYEKDDDFSDIINLLRECSELGFYIVIFSASSVDRYRFMIDYVEKLGIKVCSAVNKNAIELPYGNWGKIYYNILLDDRSGLKQSYEILKTVVGKIKSKNRFQESEKR